MATFGIDIQGALESAGFKGGNSVVVGWVYAEAYRLVSGTYNADGALLSGSIEWPDGATGTFVADAISATDAGLIDGYTVTHALSGVTITLQQPAVTRNADYQVVPPVPALIITES